MIRDNLPTCPAIAGDEDRIRLAIAAWHAGKTLDRDQQETIDRLLVVNYVDQIAPALRGAS